MSKALSKHIQNIQLDINTVFIVWKAVPSAVS